MHNTAVVAYLFTWNFHEGSGIETLDRYTDTGINIGKYTAYTYNFGEILECSEMVVKLRFAKF